MNTPRPRSVTYATWLMYAGAALAVVTGIVFALSSRSIISHMVAQMERGMPASQQLPPATLDSLHGVLAGTMIAEGVILALLWLWMAWKNGQGRQWARILSTVFFGILCLSTVSSVANIPLMGIGPMIMYLLMFAVGLAAVILLYRPESSQYYQAVKMERFGGYPPAGGPGGYYGYGTPQSTYGYGYPPPPPNPEDPPNPAYPNE